MSEYCAFNDALSVLNVSSSLLLNETYQMPWGIEIPDGVALSKMLGATSGTKVIAFHFVRRGSFVLRTEKAEPLVIRAGEIAICAGSRQHVMSDGVTSAIVPLAEVLDRSTIVSDCEGAVGETELICGVFMLRNTKFNPLVEALPNVVQVDVSRSVDGTSLNALAELLVAEINAARPGHEYMCSRILELLCAAAIRAHMNATADQPASWFKGLRDAKIGAAIARIHAAPDQQICNKTLARSVGMSTSRFAARFKEEIGIPPMSYVSRWRMNVAARLLAETDKTVERISRAVGYDSLPAFNRAFRKHFEQPPAAWRKGALD